MDKVEAIQIKKKAEDSILRKPNVVATGIGYKNGDPKQGLAVIASVTKKKPAGLKKGHVSRLQRVPKSVDGLQTDVQEVGVFYPLQNPTERFRPIPAGVSVGHIKITAGTVCLWANYDGSKVLLSNNHVLANSNDAVFGESIVQPGIYDGGRNPEDVVAILEKFVPIQFEGGESDCDLVNMIAGVVNWCSRKLGRKSELRTYVTDRAAENYVDVAIARPLDEGLVKLEWFDGTKFNGWTEFDLGEKVRKWGRTTGKNEDQIIQVEVTAMVSYGVGKIAKFVGQYMAGAMSQGGDSGSGVANLEDKVGGVLFAGSDTTTIINPFNQVLSFLPGLSF